MNNERCVKWGCNLKMIVKCGIYKKDFPVLYKCVGIIMIGIITMKKKGIW